MNFVHRGSYFPEAAPASPEAAVPSPSPEAAVGSPSADEARAEAHEDSSEPLAPTDSLPSTRAGLPAVEQRREQLPSEREDLKRASR